MDSYLPPFKVFSGTKSRYMAEEICKELGVELGSMKIEHFADGEFEVSFEESVRGCEVYLVQSTFPNCDNLMELLLMIDAAKRASAKSVMYVWDEHRRGIEVVYRHIEKPLDLVCVQVHGNYTVYAGCDEHVGNKLGGDRHTRLILAVLTGPAEVRHHGDNRFCRGALGSVNHKEH